MTSTFRFGIDLGGTKIEIVALDASGAIRHRQRVQTPAGDYRGSVVGRRIVTGANAIAGEWDHNPLPLPTAEDHPLPLCYCGRRACIETYLSGPGLSSDHARASGERLAAEEIAGRAAAGDAAC